jgi:hypothetical protein
MVQITLHHMIRDSYSQIYFFYLYVCLVEAINEQKRKYRPKGSYSCLLPSSFPN